MKKSEMMLKEVVDINTGKIIGYIEDVEFDPDQGKIEAVIIPSNHFKLLRFFSKKQDVEIGWKDIKKIGEDVILVDKNTV